MNWELVRDTHLWYTDIETNPHKRETLTSKHSLLPFTTQWCYEHADCYGVCLHAGTVFYGRNQSDMLMRNSAINGRGNRLHTTVGVSGNQLILGVSQGQ